MNFKEYLRLFKLRNLSFLIFSGTFSQFGDRLTHMLLITLIGISSPGKVSAFSVASLTFTLPVIIFSPLFGVLVDRWSRRSIMIRAHLIQALILFLAPFLMNWTNSFMPFWFIITAFFTIDIFNNTAKPAMMPNLVAPRKLLSANSLDQLLARFATVLGMVLGGFLIAKIGWQWGFIFNASMHLCAGLLIFGIAESVVIKPIHQLNLNNQKRIFESFSVLVNDIKEILCLMRKDRIVNIVISSFVLITFIASVSYTILIFLIQQVLKMGTQGVGIMSGILAFGMILGALVVGIFHIRMSKLNIIIYSFLVYGLLFLVGPFFISKLLVMTIALVGGIIFSFITVAQNTMLQEQVSSVIRGRIYSVKEFFVNVTFILTALLIGMTTDFTSIKITLLGVGFILILLSVLTFIYLSKPKTIDAQ